MEPAAASSLTQPEHVLLPVLPVGEVCLFPESSLSLTVTAAAALKALELAARMGGCVLAIAQKEGPEGKELQSVGTIARVTLDLPAESGGRAVELDGLNRGRACSYIAGDTLVAEVEPLEEGDAGDDWGPAVEALARYLHAHADLRSHLDQRRRSTQPMAWVNLACQHLPITASARQKLLESAAAERCLKISRGLEALLRKELG